MGQKSNPKGLRLGIIFDWDSNWFALHKYKEYVLEDYKIRNFLNNEMHMAGICLVKIGRKNDIVEVHAKVSRSGVLYGKSGLDIDTIKQELEKIVQKKVVFEIIDEKNPDLNAKLLSSWVAEQLEKRVPFRRAMKMSIQRSMRAGAKGIKVICAGRLGGIEIARTEHYHEGSIPLNTFRANIQSGFSEALTTFGKIGVKVYVNLGEVTEMIVEAKPKIRKKKKMAEG